MPETWKEVPGMDFLEASSLGRIRRCKPSGKRGKVGLIFSPTKYYRYPGAPPYLYFCAGIGGCGKTFWVHRLVCRAFHGDPPTLKHVAAHIDGDSLNNRPSNLYWATQLQNLADTVRQGRSSRGERRPSAKLTNAAALAISERLYAGARQTDLAKEYGVSDAIISCLKTGRSWRHITGRQKHA